MRKGTTPTLTFEVEDLELSSASVIWITFKQGSTIIKKTNTSVQSLIDNAMYISKS